MDNKTLLSTAIQAAYNAGNAILKIYNSESELEVERKSDDSPVTIADKAGHSCICKYLETTGLPILSEEGKDIPFKERSEWKTFWMVDPLDGTKEFIKKNGEFTVNIALIQHNNPIMGVIWVPVKQILYFGEQTLGAYKISGINALPADMDTLISEQYKLPKNEIRDEYVVVASRSHLSDDTIDFIKNLKKKHNPVTTTSMGSSLKLCLVAEGKADIYPRFAPTMEWDTAAGQAIVQASGKTVIDYDTSMTMRYNKENLLNNWFIVE
ncbi:MAG: 3'(2'),5'-bisphosphate nucleotidase CysQ [Desulfobacterales bacterium]|nr:3'(2'),5'-bisphosphate nucleotidase CysQ [Desulfobacterales bacterium]